MNDPTLKSKKRGLVSSRFTATIDDRGRIFLPAEIRKTLGMTKGEILFLYPLTSKNAVVLKRGDKK